MVSQTSTKRGSIWKQIIETKTTTSHAILSTTNCHGMSAWSTENCDLFLEKERSVSHLRNDIEPACTNTCTCCSVMNIRLWKFRKKSTFSKRWQKFPNQLEVGSYFIKLESSDSTTKRQFSIELAKVEVDLDLKNDKKIKSPWISYFVLFFLIIFLKQLRAYIIENCIFSNKH